MTLSRLLLLPLVVAGCSSSVEEPGGGTGAVRFELMGWQHQDCTQGCAPDRPVLAGSKITLFGYGDFTTTFTSRSTDEERVELLNGQASCHCRRLGPSPDGFASRLIEPDQGCEPIIEHRTCSYSVFALTGRPGDAHVELVGANGAVVDRSLVRVRDAASLTLQTYIEQETGEPGSAAGGIASGPGAVEGDVREVDVGNLVQILPVARDASGAVLVNTLGGYQFELSGDHAAEPEGPQGELPVYRVRAVRSGTTRVTARVGTIERTAEIIVR
jgi:hypothetical protein